MNRQSMEFILQVACDARLSKIQLRVLLYYVGRMNAKTRTAFAKTLTISLQTGIDGAHIKRARVTLLELGWLTEVAAPGVVRNYRVQIPADLLQHRKSAVRRDLSERNTFEITSRLSCSNEVVADSATQVVAISATHARADSATAAVADSAPAVEARFEILGSGNRPPIQKKTNNCGEHTGDFDSHFLGDLAKKAKSIS